MNLGWLKSAAVVVGVCACILGVGCSSRSPIDAPVAAVMDTKGKVVLVDLERGAVLDTIRMRSWTGDIAADPYAGTFVTAQCGGVGNDADDKLGIIDVRGDRAVRYVTLPRPNPGGVEIAGPNRVLVDHGWMEPQGMFACLVDTKAEEVIKEGYVPDNTSPLRVVDGVGWSSGVDAMTDEVSLSRIDLETLSSEVVTQGADARIDIECATSGGLVGWLRGRTGEALLARFDSDTGAAVASVAPDFVDGAGRLVLCGDRLVAVDCTGEDMDRAGDRLLVFDAASLRQQRVIPLTGGPTDVATWRDRVVVANWRDDTLQVIDPATGAIERTVQLPEMVDLVLNLAVLDT